MQPNRRRRRFWWATAVGVASTIVPFVVIFTQGRPFWTIEPPRGPAYTELGDPHTADPCALADAGIFTRFGSPQLTRDYGGLNRCDVLIEVGDATVDVKYEWDGPDEDDPGGLPTPVARLAAEPSEEDCAIPIVLADRSVVAIVAEEFDPVDLDLCEVASVAADHAMGVVDDFGEIPRLSDPPAGSVAHLDACALLGAADLAAVPGFAGAQPDPGFADWSCRWRDPNGDALVRVVFDRNDPDEAREGRPLDLPGREAYVEEEGYGEGTCAVFVFHRQYRDEYGEPHVELALVVGEGGRPVDQLCQLATEFAPPVAGRLPAL